MNPKIAKAIAELLRTEGAITIRQVENGLCYQVEIGPEFGCGETLEEAVCNALDAVGRLNR